MPRWDFRLAAATPSPPVGSPRRGCRHLGGRCLGCCPISLRDAHSHGEQHKAKNLLSGRIDRLCCKPNVINHKKRIRFQTQRRLKRVLLDSHAGEVGGVSGKVSICYQRLVKELIQIFWTRRTQQSRRGRLKIIRSRKRRGGGGGASQKMRNRKWTEACRRCSSPADTSAGDKAVSLQTQHTVRTHTDCYQGRDLIGYTEIGGGVGGGADCTSRRTPGLARHFWLREGDDFGPLTQS